MRNRRARKRRRNRRTVKRNLVTNSDWNIMLSNIRGFNSKELSLNEIVRKKPVDMLVLNETLMKKNKKPKLQGFKCFPMNRIKSSGGGVASYIRNKDASNALKMTEGTNENEFIVTRHGQFFPAINVINFYGSQERRTEKERLDNNWGEILHEIKNIENKGELLVLIGDMNRHLGDLIKGNEADRMSYGGK